MYPNHVSCFFLRGVKPRWNLAVEGGMGQESLSKQFAFNCSKHDSTGSKSFCKHNAPEKNCDAGRILWHCYHASPFTNSFSSWVLLSHAALLRSYCFGLWPRSGKLWHGLAVVFQRFILSGCWNSGNVIIINSPNCDPANVNKQLHLPQIQDSLWPCLCTSF